MSVCSLTGTAVNALVPCGFGCDIRFYRCSRLSCIALKNHLIRMALTALLFSSALNGARDHPGLLWGKSWKHKNGSLHCGFFQLFQIFSSCAVFKPLIYDVIKSFQRCVVC
ncbi:hypothetical protein R3I94_014682 [Phoxinus phoxinus]